jgi:hypothetical protein
MRILNKRTLSLIFNLVVIGLGLYVMVKMQDNEENIAIWFYQHMPRLRPFAKFMPSLFVSLLNFVLPTFTKMMVEYEQHDFPEEKTRQEIFRNFFITMVNLCIFTLISYNGIFDTSFLDMIFGTNFKKQF